MFVVGCDFCCFVFVLDFCCGSVVVVVVAVVLKWSKKDIYLFLESVIRFC